MTKVANSKERIERAYDILCMSVIGLVSVPSG